ncbi:DNA repair protein RadA, partial [Francisellaceae bacterium]|nr:DNA repair protein RadA [Francisellaceae bacterium]
RNHCALFLVGHVTKSGEVAGPRVLEHIVDAVVFIEGQSDGRYRVMRAMKNRFGAVNEVGIFAMTDQGMKEVKNPSAIFLNRSEEDVSGSSIVSMWEGSRPFLAEIQALVDENNFGQPRRVCVGVDTNRLAMLLAVLHRHARVHVGEQDIFVNVVGGVKILETSADLAIVAAITSSLKNKVIPKDWIIFGEVGLSGEIRPVPYGQERIQEAQKHGFSKAIVPFANKPKQALKGLEVIAVKTLFEAIEHI